MSSHSLDVLTRLSTRVPVAVTARAEAWHEGDVPAEPVLSASVILLRDTSDGLETYLLHRHARMPFAASMVVFPGGKVDPADAETAQDPVRACALRETHEETSVELSDADLLPWAHWTTPEVEPRRFDTHFFVSALPTDQQPQDVSGETDRAAWATPGATLAEFERGEIALMPPTLSVLLELVDVADVAAIREVARDRVIVSVLPRVIRAEGGWTFAYPVRR